MALGVLTNDITTKVIYRHSGFSSTVLEQLSISGYTSPDGIAWDGTNLLSADGGAKDIYKYNGFSTTELDSFSMANYITGIAWDGTNLLSASADSDKIYQHIGFSSSINATIAAPAFVPQGIAWDGTNLLSCDNNEEKIYKHSGFSTTIDNTLTSPALNVKGLDWDRANLLSVDGAGGTDTIYKHVGFSSSIDSSFSSPASTPWGVAWRADFLEPDGDVAQSGGWEPEPADGAVLWTTMDEFSPDDTDYAWHNAIAPTEYFEISLSNPSGTPGVGTQTVYWRLDRIGGAKTTYIKCELRQGAIVKASQTVELTDALQALSFTNSAEITDWTDLRLRFLCDSVSGGGAASDPAITWAIFEIPLEDPVAPTYIPKIMMIT